MQAQTKPNEIRTIRTYEAPLKTVWEAWTDPVQTAEWWGPRGFTVTTHSKELKIGGIWHYTMHGPDGVDYPNKTQYLDIKTYSRLVYDHGGYDDRPPMFRVTVLFSEENGRTKMDMTMAMASAEAAEQTKTYIRKVGGEATWDRLAEYLSKKASENELFVITRTFEAPVETVFEMWTNPKHFGNWMGPAGASLKFFRAEMKPGGSSFYKMDQGNEPSVFGRAEYLNIEKPSRIVYIQQFCDANEKVARHPLANTWPETMLTVVAFEKEGDSRTRVTLTWEPHGATTQQELETFTSARAGMHQGWTGSFDKLEDYLRN